MYFLNLFLTFLATTRNYEFSEGFVKELTLTSEGQLFYVEEGYFTKQMEIYCEQLESRMMILLSLVLEVYDKKDLDICIKKDLKSFKTLCYRVARGGKNYTMHKVGWKIA